MSGKFNRELFDAVVDGVTRKGIETYGPRVMVLLYDKVDQIGSIILAEEAQEVPKVGTVVALGQGFSTPDGEGWKFAQGIAVGHHVTFNQYDGKEHAVSINPARATAMGLRNNLVKVLVFHAGNLYLGWKE